VCNGVGGADGRAECRGVSRRSSGRSSPAQYANRTSIRQKNSRTKTLKCERSDSAVPHRRRRATRPGVQRGRSVVQESPEAVRVGGLARLASLVSLPSARFARGCLAAPFARIRSLQCLRRPPSSNSLAPFSPTPWIAPPPSVAPNPSYPVIVELEKRQIERILFH